MLEYLFYEYEPGQRVLIWNKQFDNFIPKDNKVNSRDEESHYLSLSSACANIFGLRVDQTTLLRVMEAESWKRKINLSSSEENCFLWVVLAKLRAKFKLKVFSLSCRDAKGGNWVEWRKDWQVVVLGSDDGSGDSILVNDSCY